MENQKENAETWIFRASDQSGYCDVLKTETLQNGVKAQALSEQSTEIKVFPEGVYIARFKKLSERQINGLRNKLEQLILKRHDWILSHKREIARWQRDLEEHETQLRVLNSKEVQDYLEELKQQKKIAEAKAEEFLREYLGSEAYEELKTKGQLTFEERNQIWKIKKDGTLLRRTKRKGNRFRKVCVLKQSGLPLPDFIASVLTTLKARPQRLTHYARR